LLAGEHDGEVGGEAEQVIDQGVVVGLDEPTLTHPRTKRGNFGVIDGALRRRRRHTSISLPKEIGTRTPSHY
jgi:hypothetical protein